MWPVMLQGNPPRRCAPANVRYLSYAVLDLSGIRIADVTALGGLPRLRVLELSGNAVADGSPLLHLTELRYLGLAGNRVADATPLSHLERELHVYATTAPSRTERALRHLPRRS